MVQKLIWTFSFVSRFVVYSFAFAGFLTLFLIYNAAPASTISELRNLMDAKQVWYWACTLALTYRFIEWGIYWVTNRDAPQPSLGVVVGRKVGVQAGDEIRGG